MIPRYTRDEIGAVWAQRRKMEGWLEVELAVTEALAEEGAVPAEEARACRQRASFTVEAVEERERTTNHDVAAFVDVVSASIGAEGRWIHYGLTSSDVLDTALATQIREAGEILVAGAEAFRDALIERAFEHRATVCVGRTHGIHAEPTSFGLRLAGFAFEADRNVTRLRRAFSDGAVGKLSGAVGTYASLPPSIEARVMERLGLGVEPASTQIVPRDRHAELLSAVALAGAGLERFATEVRNLQRTEVREVEEPFGKGQKGSSAMPHKKNPIVSERICGMARVVRAQMVPVMEGIPLWHERDISHSSVERVALPDASIGTDYLLHLTTRLVQGLVVDADRMRANLDATGGLIYTSAVLLELVEGGQSREDAYALVQSAAMQTWETGTPFRETLRRKADEAGQKIDEDRLDEVCRPERYVQRLDGVFDRVAQLS